MSKISGFRSNLNPKHTPNLPKVRVKPRDSRSNDASVFGGLQNSIELVHYLFKAKIRLCLRFLFACQVSKVFEHKRYWWITQILHESIVHSVYY